MAGVRPRQIDIIYDSGTVSIVTGEQKMNILRNVEEEDVLIETVTGKHLISKLYGDTIFGKIRILKEHCGSVLVSQYAAKKLNPDEDNPDEDTFILNNPTTKEKIWCLSVVRRDMMTN
jgi:hypothetical protein